MTVDIATRSPGTTRIGQPMLACSGLKRSYDEIVAVDDVSFSIEPGETYGLLGPNGAGKTTIISMTAGILRPDAGEVRIDGHTVSERSVREKGAIGYVPQDIALYPDLSGRENLTFFARLYGLSRADARRQVDSVLAAISLTERADDQVSKYSGGMKRRLNIGAGLLHRPRLLILDEPTAGVDPQSRNAILASVETLAAEGMAVLYTTHYMEEAQRLCDRVGIVDKGRLIAEGTVRELTALVGERDRILLEATGALDTAAQQLSALASVQGVSVGEGRLELLVQDSRTALPEILAVAARDVQVRSVQVQEPDLEAVFLHLTGKSLRE